MSTHGLVLAARDAEDLEVISARLQDSVAKLGDFVYLKKKRCFFGLFNRFKWEDGKKGNLRVRSGLHFDGVLAVRSKNVKLGADDAVVELLAVNFAPKPGETPSGTVELVFAGGGIILLEVECLDASLSDVGAEWAARGRPAHEIESQEK